MEMKGCRDGTLREGSTRTAVQRCGSSRSCQKQASPQIMGRNTQNIRKERYMWLYWALILGWQCAQLKRTKGLESENEISSLRLATYLWSSAAKRQNAKSDSNCKGCIISYDRRSRVYALPGQISLHNVIKHPHDLPIFSDSVNTWCYLPSCLLAHQTQ